jgi:nucleotide exchange factor SIL1
MVLISSRRVLGTACLFLPLLAHASSDPVASPSVDTELICAPDNPDDCYLRIFEPTKDFQIIKEGQDLPPGLHIRINLETGLKEARLNIPIEGEESVESQLEGLPTEQSMVVVDQPEADSEEPGKPALRDQVPINPPSYDAAGKVPPPIPNAESGDEMSTFQTSMLAIKMEARAFDKALDDLNDLAHDIYYGVEIAKDGPVLEKLVCLTLGAGTQRMDAKENGRDHKAASILGSALQNNPTALKEIAGYNKMVVNPTCGQSGSKSQDDFVKILRSGIGGEKNPATLRAKVGAISGILREPTFRDEFLKRDGMELLLAMFLKKGEDFDIVRKKVGQLVMDNFLDEGMGASLGVWPKSEASSSKTCQDKENMLDDGCWDHHVDTFSQATPNAAWAKDLLAALKEERGRSSKGRKEREL